MYMFFLNMLIDMYIICCLRYRLVILWKVKRVYIRLIMRKCYLDFCIFLKFYMCVMKYIFDWKNGFLLLIYYWYIFLLLILLFIVGVFFLVCDLFLWKEWIGIFVFCYVRKLGLYLMLLNLVWFYIVLLFFYE